MICLYLIYLANASLMKKHKKLLKIGLTKNLSPELKLTVLLNKKRFNVAFKLILQYVVEEIN